MGNCLKGCLPRHSQEGCSRRTARLNASDSQYEILIEGATTDHCHRSEEKQEHRGAIRSKATGKSKFFRKFWPGNRDVDYARLSKASNGNNNFTNRPSSSSGRSADTTGATDGGGSSKHNQHTTAATGWDIQLQCLDAHSLLLVSKDGPRKSAINGQGHGSSDLLQTDQTSSPGSSLDLEWENDYGGYAQAGCQWAFSQQQQQLQQHPAEALGAASSATAHLVSFPVAIQESVFKIEEWSMVKKSKDRINALRRLDQPPAPGQAREEVAGSLECLRVRPPLSAPFERRSTFSLNSVGGSSDLSHISSSTPDGSLEWDLDQDRQLKSEHDGGESEIDFETKELLLEIEQLKNRVLNETGAALRDDHAMIS
ncbi:uncharacterized protein LOC118461872 [Anopheles albimanus]|uniref:uncharacterized protein LOC118461872 n=1 Tax=Anopheles albimanus TaxID=7167 RepID=UPI001640E072|nr:uncharacterized protein LOC118461872 [Anopheles albimanus]